MIKRNLVPILILMIIFAFILQPAIVSQGAFKGLLLWINKIVPFLFPMFILSNILLQYNFMYSLLERFAGFSSKILKSKFALIPYFISFISGYPSGASVVDVMICNGKISTKEAAYMLTFTNNCSFQFISAVIAFSMLGNFNLFIYVAVPHYLGAVILSFLHINEPVLALPNKISKQKQIHFNQVFSSAISKSILSILTVGGVIVIFSVFAEYIMYFLCNNSIFANLNANVKDIIFSVLIGFLEMTNGCSIISASALPLHIKLIIINFLVSFSGMSIIFQTIAVTSDFDFNLIKYIKSKFVFGIISALICIVMIWFI